MSRRAGVVVLLLSLVPARAGSQGVTIEHGEIACVVAGQFPRIDARITPAEQVAKARTFFHADDDALWYFVEMKAEAGVFQGVLPRPLKTAKRIHYYIETTDKAVAQTRTQEYAPEVVPDAGACSKKGAVAAIAGAATKVVVGGQAGGSGVPAGFAASAAATAGGISTTALVVGGVVVAGGAAAVAVKAAAQSKSETYAIEGTVYKIVGPGTGLISPVQSGPTVAGAVVSTSLDGKTATADAQGRFVLVPDTRCEGTGPNPRGGVGGVEFTVRIMAAGCDTASTTKQWGCAKVGKYSQSFNLRCP